MFTLLVIQYFIQQRVQPQNIWTECTMFTEAYIYIRLQASIANLLTILRLLTNWPCSKFSDISTKFLYISPNKTIFYWQLWYSYNKTNSTQICKKNITQIFRTIIFVDGVHLNCLCTNYMQWPLQPLKRPPCCLKMFDTRHWVTWHHISEEQRHQLHYYKTLKTSNFCNAFNVSLVIIIWYLMIICLARWTKQHILVKRNYHYHNLD